MLLQNSNRPAASDLRAFDSVAGLRIAVDETRVFVCMCVNLCFQQGFTWHLVMGLSAA